MILTASFLRCDPGSWAEKYGFTKYDPDIEHYITAVYWAGTTMTTTGEV